MNCQVAEYATAVLSPAPLESKSHDSQFYNAVHDVGWELKKELQSSYHPAPHHSSCFAGEPQENHHMLYKLAKKLGAGSMGVASFNPLWIYSHDANGKPIQFPESCDKFICLTFPMDPEELSSSPSIAADMENSLGYMKCSLALSTLAKTITKLGFIAIASDNNFGLSIPIAIDAGLGVLGRNGLLLTPDFGPCVRLGKILTNMPLTVDKPLQDFARKVCLKCGKCARNCPSGAISNEEKPGFNIACNNNNPGYFHWPVHAEKCLSFWKSNHTSCSNCITSCPFTPK